MSLAFDRKHDVGTAGMIATGHPLAARAAWRILEEGGNAIDAAIAADAVMGVVEPMATSIGGDLLAMLVHPDGRVQSYNGTGRAPMALHAEHIDALPGRRIPERHPLSVTTPGAVRGWADLHQAHGRMPWADLFADAIEACAGFAVAPVAAREWALFAPVIRADPAASRSLRADAPPRAGERFANPELGTVLAAIRAGGADAFYLGDTARAAAQAVRQAGGVLAEEDFALHRGHFCDPVSAPFHGAVVHQCPPNTHGIAILDALTRVAQAAPAPHSPAAAIAMVGAMAEGLALANRVVADPAGNTVCTVIVDRDGLAITLMSSVFKRFGSGIGVPGGGFILQNRGFGFSLPGHRNGPAPGKRPYHTVVPGAVTRDGRFLMGLGVVGGLMQPQGQVQLLTRLLAWDQPLAEAMAAPRWRLEAGSTLALETGMPADVADALRAAGYPAPAAGVGELAGRSDFGGAQVVRRLADGRLEGASDPRKDGAAVALGHAHALG